MLIDTATIFVRSGHGGDGAVSFRRAKYIPKGGPDGGDGGKGASVILIAKAGVDTLLDLAGRHHYHAENGEPGRGKQQYGKDGTDLLVNVPPGTLIYDKDNGELIDDLDQPGKQRVVAVGGKGGFGNEHFKSPTNQTPRQSTPGEPAEEKTLRLELKLIAEVGLIGLPNAGKSTLLSVISRARPKIADYPFTTLEPNLGIAELSAHRPGVPRRLVVADLPGLIEGAHTGQGLGTRFLRHVERTRVIVHLIELDPADGSDPAQNYQTVRNELSGYSKQLARTPEVIALSKIDLAGDQADRQAAVQLVEQELGKMVSPISSATHEGIAELLESCWKILNV